MSQRGIVAFVEVPGFAFHDTSQRSSLLTYIGKLNFGIRSEDLNSSKFECGNIECLGQEYFRIETLYQES